MAEVGKNLSRIEVVVSKGSEVVIQKGNETQSLETSTPTNAVSSGTGSSDNGEAPSWLTKVFGSSSKQRIKRVIKTNLTHTIAITKQIADLAIENYVAGIGYASGDQAYQDFTQREIEKIKDTTNVASSIGIGALYGAWGGPIGAILGASFGAIQSSASISYKYKGRQREYDYTMFKENNAIEYRRARANIDLTNGRLR